MVEASRDSHYLRKRRAFCWIAQANNFSAQPSPMLMKAPAQNPYGHVLDLSGDRVRGRLFRTTQRQLAMEAYTTPAKNGSETRRIQSLRIQVDVLQNRALICRMRRSVPDSGPQILGRSSRPADIWSGAIRQNWAKGR